MYLLLPKGVLILAMRILIFIFAFSASLVLVLGRPTPGKPVDRMDPSSEGASCSQVVTEQVPFENYQPVIPEYDAVQYGNNIEWTVNLNDELKAFQFESPLPVTKYTANITFDHVSLGNTFKFKVYKIKRQETPSESFAQCLIEEKLKVYAAFYNGDGTIRGDDKKYISNFYSIVKSDYVGNWSITFELKPSTTILKTIRHKLSTVANLAKNFRRGYSALEAENTEERNKLEVHFKFIPVAMKESRFLIYGRVVNENEEMEDAPVLPVADPQKQGAAGTPGNGDIMLGYDYWINPNACTEM